MPRPKTCRFTERPPDCAYFKPRGVPMRDLSVVTLELDEFEAIRLADLEGLYQEDAAVRMGVSRQTFGRIIDSAHNKIADALTNGRALRIAGGVVSMSNARTFSCASCGHTWSVPYGTGRPAACPSCDGANFSRADDERGGKGPRGRGQGGRGRCRRMQNNLKGEIS